MSGASRQSWRCLLLTHARSLSPGMKPGSPLVSLVSADLIVAKSLGANVWRKIPELLLASHKRILGLLTSLFLDNWAVLLPEKLLYFSFSLAGQQDLSGF